MASFREMIYSVKEKMNAYSDDNTVADELIAFMLNNKRATYLEVLANNPKRSMPKEAYQDICIKLLPAAECEDEGVILVSTFPLPASINNEQDTEGIGRVKLESIMAKWINIISQERVPFISAGRFNANQIYVSKNQKNELIIFSPSNSHIFLRDVTVSIIAENPEEADKFVCLKSGEVQCDFYDKKYPVPESLIAPMVQEVFNELLEKSRLSQDSSNNGSDDMLNQKIPYYGPRRQSRQQQGDQEMQ